MARKKNTLIIHITDDGTGEVDVISGQVSLAEDKIAFSAEDFPKNPNETFTIQLQNDANNPAELLMDNGAPTSSTTVDSGKINTYDLNQNYDLTDADNWTVYVIVIPPQKSLSKSEFKLAIERQVARLGRNLRSRRIFADDGGGDPEILVGP